MAIAFTAQLASRFVALKMSMRLWESWSLTQWLEMRNLSRNTLGVTLGIISHNIPSDPDLGGLTLKFLPQQHCCRQQLLFLHRPLLIVGNGCLIHLFSPSQGFCLPRNAIIWANGAVILSVWSEFEFVLNIQVLSPKRLYIHALSPTPLPSFICQWCIPTVRPTSYQCKFQYWFMKKNKVIKKGSNRRFFCPFMGEWWATIDQAHN